MASEREQKVRKLLERRVQSAFPNIDTVLARLAGDESLTFYLGVDPTSPHLHMGHTVPMFLLAGLQELGHKIILLIGDFTARIGDPTDKTATRKALSDDEVRENMSTYIAQVEKIIPRGAFDVQYNSTWLSSLNFSEVIQLASHVTVQQMIQRDMFQERMKQDKPIYLHEFFYPLMQAYDSVALRVDGEVGGNDQIFNMLLGRELEKELLGKEKLVLAAPLIVEEETGKKMSKSEGPVIALDDSPQEIRRKVLMMNDGTVASVFTLCTKKDLSWIDEQSEAHDPRAMKEELAEELVRVYHGASAVGEAASAIKITAIGSLDRVLKESGLAVSMTAAKQLIQQRGVAVNGVIAERWDLEIKKGDEIKVGKGKFVKII